MIDPKVQLFKRLNEAEPKLQVHCTVWTVHLTSFIIAPGTYEETAKTSWVREHSREEFERNNVVFGEASGYIKKLLDKAIGRQ